MSPDSTPQQLEADLERQREELAETITELHERLDVRRQPKVLAIAGVAVVAVVGLVLWRKTH